MVNILSVKKFYSNSIYFENNYHIKVRRYLVKTFVENYGKEFNQILDIGCGNGSVSIPLLSETNHLTLLDLTDEMIARAEKNVPEGFKKNVKLISGNAIDIDLEENKYDLIICLGLLAHFESPEKLILKIKRSLKSEGVVIIQNSDDGHWFNKLFRQYEKIKNLLRRKDYDYELNRISHKYLIGLLKDNGLEPAMVYRYLQSFLFMARIISVNFLFKVIVFLFGKVFNNRLRFFGSECIYFLKNQIPNPKNQISNPKKYQ